MSDQAAYTVGQTLWTVADQTHVHGYWVDEDVWRTTWRSASADLVEWTVVSVTPAGAWVIDGKLTDNIVGSRQWVSSDPKRHGRTQAEARDKAARLRAYHVRCCEQRAADARDRLAAILAISVAAPPDTKEGPR